LYVPEFNIELNGCLKFKRSILPTIHLQFVSTRK